MFLPHMRLTETSRTEWGIPFAPGPLQTVQHYYGMLRPCAPHRYSVACRWSGLRDSLGIGTTGSHVPLGRLVSGRATLYADCRPGSTQVAPGLITGQNGTRLSTASFHSRRLIAWFACARLRDTTSDAVWPHLFPDRSPREALDLRSTGAIYRLPLHGRRWRARLHHPRSKTLPGSTSVAPFSVVVTHRFVWVPASPGAQRRRSVPGWWFLVPGDALVACVAVRPIPARAWAAQCCDGPHARMAAGPGTRDQGR